MISVLFKKVDIFFTLCTKFYTLGLFSMDMKRQTMTKIKRMATTTTKKILVKSPKAIGAIKMELQA